MESLGNMQNIGLWSFHTIYNIQGKSPKHHSRKICSCFDLLGIIQKLVETRFSFQEPEHESLLNVSAAAARHHFPNI